MKLIYQHLKKYTSLVCPEMIVFEANLCFTADTLKFFFRTKAGTSIVRLSHRNSVCPPACLSDHHTGGSVKNCASYEHQIFTIGCLKDSSFSICKTFP